MLQLLRIKNLALLDEASLEFGPGFTAVTGETGAGKSVLLGALSLLAGARSDKTLVGKHSDTTDIEASLYFESPDRLNSALEAQGLPLCEEGVLILRRTLGRTKPGRVFINGALATITALHTLGESWIDFHGPGEPQKLFHERHQLSMLDLFSGAGDLLEGYQSGFRDWQTKLREIERLRSSDRLSEDEIGFYQGQIDKIDAVATSQEAVESLERQYSRSERSQELMALSQKLVQGLSSQHGQFAGLLRSARDLAEIDEAVEPLVERLEGLIIDTEDLSGEFSSIERGTDASEYSQQELDFKMQQWMEIQRQYGAGIEAVLLKRNMLFDKVALQSDLEGTLQSMQKEADADEASLREVADGLAKQRRIAAKVLSKKVESLLGDLGFKKARFSINLIAEDKLRETGNLRCEFLFAPNVGEPLLALAKIASSGETARVMLALKTVLAEVDKTPLLVFDEVDANVGGEIGAQVGRRLKGLSGDHQVLCVTHLPQVAAQSESHFVVTKHQSDSKTTVSMGPIQGNFKNRITELARMLGDRNAPSALKHAKELLKLN